MFGKKKTLSSILGTFTGIMKDLELFSEECVQETVVLNETIRVAQEDVSAKQADRAKADRVLANLQKIVEGE